MNRPWIQPSDVKAYTSSDKVTARDNTKLTFDIARAERYVIFYTNNKFDTEEYSTSLPPDVMMAVTLLAEAYAKQSIRQKDGAVESETFDDYSYTLSDEDLANSLNLGIMLDDYVLHPDCGKVTMKLRKL